MDFDPARKADGAGRPFGLGDQYFTVPRGCSTLDIVATGAGGGPGWSSAEGKSSGASGIVVHAIAPTAPGTNYRIVVGAGGIQYDLNIPAGAKAGYGGGLAGVIDTHNSPVVIAGAGGGAGSYTNGGKAGMLNGEDGATYTQVSGFSYYSGGGGSSQSAGGIGGYWHHLYFGDTTYGEDGGYLTGGNDARYRSYDYGPSAYGGGGVVGWTGGGGAPAITAAAEVRIFLAAEAVPVSSHLESP